MTKEKMLVEKISQMVNLAIRATKTPRDYGGVILYYSEIHALEAINNHCGENISTLAEHIAVTVGAVWQVARKLKAKGLIEQYHQQHNNKDVYFRLTDLGRTACNEHIRYHKSLNPEFSDFVDRLSEQEAKVIVQFLDGMIKGVVGIV
ncbi:MAG: winged helix DNA-binding protein [Desulfovibrio sp.]|nr:winged helix DNA-binding protein [Desulfovibrio sp.]